MGGQGSGRHGAKREADGSFGDGASMNPSSAAPDLDGTPETNARFCAWVAREGALGNVPANVGTMLVNAAGKEQSAVRLRHGLHELDELRSLVATMRDAVQTRARQEQQERYTAGTPGEVATFGRVRATPPDGGDPH